MQPVEKLTKISTPPPPPPPPKQSLNQLFLDLAIPSEDLQGNEEKEEVEEEGATTTTTTTTNTVAGIDSTDILVPTVPANPARNFKNWVVVSYIPDLEKRQIWEREVKATLTRLEKEQNQTKNLLACLIDLLKTFLASSSPLSSFN